MASMAIPHPLDPLYTLEIGRVACLLRNEHAPGAVRFRAITLLEPAKKDLIGYLEAERTSSPLPPRPPRQAMVWYYRDDDPYKFFEARVDLDSDRIIQETSQAGRHCFIDVQEMHRAEESVLADPQVQDALRAMDLPKDSTVCVEAWSYAPDGMNDMSRRYISCYLYMRIGSHRDGNHYAYPLDLFVELDAAAQKVMGIYQTPLRGDENMKPLKGPPRKFDHRKLHPVSEYHPDLNKSQRTDLKPYCVVQPQGPSFRIQRKAVEWQKWKFRVGFNFREGLVLHNITYDGRRTFYRLSLSEMFVPYGDPRSPYPRKAAFDFGNVGAGIAANNLALGCDCLGTVKYFSFWHHTPDGLPLKLPNVVCCHEADDGILWKHTNFRTGNAAVTRSRVLILQSIITVGNYEYIFAFILNQAGEISYETRATGIVSTSPIELGVTVPFGTNVAPGVMAPCHQHLFCLRIDPAVDGYNNSFQIEESVPMAINDPSVNNLFGVGFVTEKRILEFEGAADLNINSNRVFKIINENVKNRISDTPVGFKIIPSPTQMLLADPSSFHCKRSEFTEHAFWVTSHRDDELYAAGVHMLQSPGGGGIASWIKNRPLPQSVRNTDIVIWHTYGSTHNVRVEDFPVMPTEKTLVTLKPFNFFDRNPALDVPVSTQAANQSVLFEETVEGARGNYRPTMTPRL